MSYNSLRKENGWTPELRTTVFVGFLLRLVMLILIIYVMDGMWDIFYIEDDKKYEELAAVYKANAHSLLDMDLFDKITLGYVQTFWPLVICVSAKLFSTIYIGRFFNILLSTLCVPVIYKLCYEISGNQKTSLTAARLFAFLPFPILVSCFPIKDLFITFSVMYAFYIFVRVQSDRKVTWLQYALCATLMICTYFSRGAVTELLLMFLLVYYLQKLLKSKQYLAALLMMMGALVIFVVFRSSIMASFDTKLEDYGGHGAEEAVGLNAIQVTGLTDIYKLPLTYAYAMLQPLKLELFSIAEDTRQWRTVMTYANITMYPVAVGAWLYMFTKKHNVFFWLSTFTMYSAVMILSLGVSRHYLFMLPINMINYALYMERTNDNYKNRRGLVIVGTFAFSVLIFCYSLVKLL